MRTSTKLKIFNDPIYGFISIPNSLILKLIAQPEFQRLRRITQMGLSHLVFPGAHHTRFHHALGSMHLMQLAIQLFRQKGIPLSAEEENGLLCAILLHDIGHGPFSHAMEKTLVEGLSHEALSLRIMEDLNKRVGGALTTAIAIFQGSYPRPFLNELVSGQLDMDRLDYLKRDSFYTGVAEGNINAERLITMLNVHEGHLVVEEKGIYSVEKFLMARRFMYWQVYLHKTSLVAEQLMIHIPLRARELTETGLALPASKPLLFFLGQRIGREQFDASVLHQFTLLDDIDLMAAVKNWQAVPDFTLSRLCSMLLNRNLPHIKLKKKPVPASRFNSRFSEYGDAHGLSREETAYFVFQGTIENTAYDRDHKTINILRDNGKVTDVARASDHLNLKALSRTVRKYYMCYPRAERNGKTEAENPTKSTV